MIRLHRTAPPAFLSPAKVTELTNEFTARKTAVWNNENIKEPLRSIGHGKCAYCECSISEESKYMEVEHFKDKHTYPHLVVDWENLLPSCKRCNGSKGTHDVVLVPIINPLDDDPKDHISFRLYRMKAKTDVGQNTIDVVDLNNPDRAVKKRFEIGEQLTETIEVATERLNSYVASQSTRDRNRLLATVGSLLIECQPEATYAATAATVVCASQEFNELVIQMRGLNLFSDEMQARLDGAISLVLDQ